jgi:arsenate reductase-like glutaredoxin family protein
LRKLPLELTEVDYARKPLDPAVVEDLVRRAGGVGPILNTRHATAKEKGWVAKPPSPAEFVKAVAKEPNLLRRPIVLAGDKLIIGFDRDAYAKLG